MNTNLEYYRVFYHVAKCRSFTQAARVLLNNQPNVSRMIRNLEGELGCALFSRSSRGVCLTPEGEALYSHVRIAMEQIRAGETELQQLLHLQEGTLSLGTSEVALRCLLLPALREYQRTYPQVRLKVCNHSTLQALDALRKGSVDISFVTFMDRPGISPRELLLTPLRELREAAVCGPALRSFLRGPVTLEQLTAWPMVSLGEETQTYGFYRELFRSRGLSFAPDLEVATADQILPMVRNNLGIGFVPEEFLRGEAPGDICPISLAEPLPPRTIYCAQVPGKALSAAAQGLLSLVGKTLREI